MTIRERRIDNEWKFLLSLQEANPATIEITGREKVCGGDWFRLLLKETSAIEIAGPPYLLRTEHSVNLHFAEFFPAVPIEAYLGKPVLHPNVHPENGFICLWSRFSSGDSVLQAVRQIQRVISWELFNPEADHLMQPEALREGVQRPLPYTPVQIPEALSLRTVSETSPGNVFRRRLS